MLCPCCSLKKYSDCCQPIIEKNIPPSNAEALMRSRYSAYSLKKVSYIYNTYAKKERVKQSLNDIKSWAEETLWLKLIIHPLPQEHINTSHTNNEVLFSAYYLTKTQKNNLTEKYFYRMREHSEFVKEDGFWRYLRGSVTEHEKMAYPARNSLCPCTSGKKFKVCCGS